MIHRLLQVFEAAPTHQQIAIRGQLEDTILRGPSSSVMDSLASKPKGRPPGATNANEIHLRSRSSKALLKWRGSAACVSTTGTTDTHAPMRLLCSLKICVGSPPVHDVWSRSIQALEQVATAGAGPTHPIRTHSPRLKESRSPVSNSTCVRCT